MVAVCRHHEDDRWSLAPGGCARLVRERRAPIAGVIARCATPEHTGPLISADSIADLASALGVPPDRLQSTVERFNRFVQDGLPIDPPHTGHPRVVAQAPFHAIPLIAGITFVTAGLLENGNAQVLDTADRPILWLYAAGQTMGGLQGGPRNGYTGDGPRQARSACLRESMPRPLRRRVRPRLLCDATTVVRVQAPMRVMDSGGPGHRHDHRA
jgi:hypothetical protein